MRKISVFLGMISLFILLSGCGEEYYSTPEKTLQRYVDNRMMMNREEYESCLNAFTKEDREWLEKNYMTLCVSLYGVDCPGEGLPTVVTIWTDVFEPAGPSTTLVESKSMDENAGTAVIVVDGKEIRFIKSRGNWKIQGLFGVPEELKRKYPEINDRA